MNIIKMILLFTVAVIMSFSVFAASVSRDMPARVSPGDAFTVSFSVSGAESGKLFTLEDDLPDTFTFVSWEVSGAKESTDKITHRAADGNRHGWSFTANQPDLVVKYNVKAPSTSGSSDFSAVWFDPAGQSTDKKSILVRGIVCGDGTCEGNENNNICPADCPAAPEPTPTPTPAPEPEIKPVPDQGGLPVGYIIAVLAIVVAVVAFFMFRKKA